MLDAPREAGAEFAAFDVTLDKPDLTAAPIRAPWAKLQQRKQAGHGTLQAD